ncbi:MAG: hypothetical protein COB15_00315 [Flavobacteriales bacterium]|nr:MAG: hypothetical protein COB15_00315 [Flavobacteriales bacterium]
METNIPEIWAYDYILAFLYILIIYVISHAYTINKKRTDSTYKHFMLALTVKLFGGIGFLLLSVYYWKGGDTFTYYNTADGLTSLFLEDFIVAFKILFTSSDNIIWERYSFADWHHNFLSDNASFTVIKITSIINLLCFRSYVATTVIYSSLSFLGVWNMYYVFCKKYPHLKKSLVLAFFFIPSVILWGSGILKDTITIAAIGWLIYAFMNIVIFKRKRMLSLVLIIIATMSIALLKPYILYVLYPCLFIWVQSNLKSLITSNLLRYLTAPVVAITLIASSFFLSKKLSENAGKYNINKIEATLEGFQSWHTLVNETKNQSGYTLGDMDFSTTGLILKIPASINVTFFRPYLWEVRNASTLLGAFEAIVLTLYSLWLVLKFRLKLFRLIFRNKDILFLLIFALIFGVVVGISSYNFGALSRYKMPAQMFYVIALILIYDKQAKKELV